MLSKATLMSLKTTLFARHHKLLSVTEKKIHQYRVSKCLQYLINKFCLQKCGTGKQIIVPDKYDTSKDRDFQTMPELPWPWPMTFCNIHVTRCQETMCVPGSCYFWKRHVHSNRTYVRNLKSLRKTFIKNRRDHFCLQKSSLTLIITTFSIKFMS